MMASPPRPCILLTCSTLLGLDQQSRCACPQNSKGVCFQELLQVYIDVFPENAATASSLPPGKACLSVWAGPRHLHQT